MKDLFHHDLNTRTIGGKLLTSSIQPDDTVESLANMFDFKYQGESSFFLKKFDIPKKYILGLIAGPSGSGKSSLLSELESPLGLNSSWDKSKAICSQVPLRKLTDIGLSNIKDLVKPYHALSTGQRHRATIARSLVSNACIDEFTSTVHEDLAKSMAIGLNKSIKRSGLSQITIATCRENLESYLDPCWVINLWENTIYLRPSDGWKAQKEDLISYERGNINDWEAFKDFHYLTEDINKSASVWIMKLNEKKVGFYAAISHPSGYMSNAVRGHRFVILPDFQGRGLALNFCNHVAQQFYEKGKKFYAKSAHPNLISLRDRDEKWLRVRQGKRSDYKGKSIKQSKNWKIHKERKTVTFEYIGEQKKRLEPIKKQSPQLSLMSIRR